MGKNKRLSEMSELPADSTKSHVYINPDMNEDGAPTELSAYPSDAGSSDTFVDGRPRIGGMGSSVEVPRLCVRI